MQAADVDFLTALQAASFERSSPATSSSYPPERRMGGPSLSGYLEMRRYLTIATVRTTGRPHAALAAFVFSRQRFWLPTMRGSARAANVREAPFVALVCADGEGAHHRAVIAEGPVEMHERLAEEPAEAWVAREAQIPVWADVWLAVRPEKLFSYDAGSPEATLVGWRCDSCGDTYTSLTPEPPVCPSCGGASATLASEPFL